MSAEVEMVDLLAINRRSADFRFRSAGIDQAHKADLARALAGRGGQPLDPVTLWEDPEAGPNAKLQVLDGIHCVAAYHAVGWGGPIPAVIFRGDRREAIGVALSRNARHVLPLPQIDRLNAAWRLVREPVVPRFRVAEVARLASVSSRVVDKMRSRWREMREANQEPTGNWSRDQHAPSSEQEEEELMSDKEREAAITALCVEIRDVLDRRKRPERAILRDGDAVGEAVVRALGDQRFKAIASYFFGSDEGEWNDSYRSDNTAGDDYESDVIGKHVKPDF